MRQINEEQIDTIRADCDNMEVHGLGVCWQAGKTANIIHNGVIPVKLVIRITRTCLVLLCE